MEFSEKASLCNIHIINAMKSKFIKMALEKEGFSESSITPGIWSHSDDFTGVLVGTNLEPEAVLRAIEITLEFWPKLKFLYLSADSGGPDVTHDQVVFGFSENVAKNLHLKPWSPKEIKAIPKKITKKEFHKLIREKCSQ